MKIFIGADHRGYKLKEELKPWLESLGHEVVDKGNRKYDPGDDFPDFAAAVARAISNYRLANNASVIGILICGSGSGMALTANKFKGIYAIVASGEDALYTNGGCGINLLAFPANINLEKAKGIINKQLNAQFNVQENYQRRLKKIRELEKRNFKL